MTSDPLKELADLLEESRIGSDQSLPPRDSSDRRSLHLLPHQRIHTDLSIGWEGAGFVV